MSLTALTALTALAALAPSWLETVRRASSGRSAHTLFGGHEHVMRQTVIDLRVGSVMHEHNNPGELAVHVLHGRVLLMATETEWNGSPGDLLIAPQSRQGLEAVEDSVALLTVAKYP